MDSTDHAGSVTILLLGYLGVVFVGLSLPGCGPQTAACMLYINGCMQTENQTLLYECPSFTLYTKHTRARARTHANMQAAIVCVCVCVCVCVHINTHTHMK
jgi:hypothetical protein